MLAARRAWPSIATHAARINEPTTRAYGTGLVALNGIGALRRIPTTAEENRKAQATPASAPAITGRAPEAKTSRISSRGVAPRAERIPSSRVLLVTEYPTTPWI